jgi:hypothetical protein
MQFSTNDVQLQPNTEERRRLLMWSKLKAFFSGLHKSRASTKPTLVCPSLEELESRDVPSGFRWVGKGADSNWTTKENWLVVLKDNNNLYPQNINDSATFDNTAPGNGGQSERDRQSRNCDDW